MGKSPPTAGALALEGAVEATRDGQAELGLSPAVSHPFPGYGSCERVPPVPLGACEHPVDVVRSTSSVQAPP